MDNFMDQNKDEVQPITMASVPASTQELDGFL
jgi:hypothetical protein